MNRLASSKSRSFYITILLIGLLFFLPLTGPSARIESILVLAMILATVAVALDLFAGYAGQFSFGHFSFVGIGAYSTTILRTSFDYPFIFAVLAGMIVCSVIAILIGAAMVRLPDLGSALTTFFFAFIVLNGLSSNFLSGWTGGVNGLEVPPLEWGGIAFDSGLPVYYLAWFALAFSALTTVVYANSRAGRALQIVKQNEAVAAILGVAGKRTRLIAFVYTAAIAGLAGAVFSILVGFLGPEMFAPAESIMLFAMVAVGGFCTVAGPILGAFFFTFIPEIFLSTGASREILFAACLLLTLVFFPNGLYGLLSLGITRCYQGISKRGESSQHNTVNSERIVPLGDVPADFNISRTSEGQLLEVRNVSVTFGTTAVLSDVSIDVKKESIHAIVGPNGAGKTTFLNVLSGVQALDTGAIYLDGHDVSGFPPHVRAKYGLARTFQHPSLALNLSVRDNVRLGLYAEEQADVKRRISGWLSSVEAREAGERVDHALDLVGFPQARRELFARELSLAEQKIVDIARALVGKPRLLLMDEPTAGLSEQEMDLIANTIRRTMVQENLSIIVIAHHVGFVLSIAEDMTVLHLGKVFAQGAPEDVVQLKKVREVFTGA